MSETTVASFSLEELQLATRNRGMPLEALRYDLTPTGLHYLLVHFDIPYTDPATWQLRIGGNVERPQTLSLDDVLALPSRTEAVTLECAGNGRAQMSPRAFSQPWLNEAIGTAEWTGTSLDHVLRAAGVRDDTVEVVFTGADHGVQGDVEHDYARSLPLRETAREEVLVAWAMNGRPLEPQHGAPLRLLVPGWYGMTSVKWLTQIDAVTTPFDGFQQTGTYRFRTDEDDPGEPVSRMRVRALMVPPGFPDFPHRRRVLPAGTTTVRGRAWSGTAPVVSVEVAVDGEWQQAEVAPAPSRYAWAEWRWSWEATPGEHVLACRATDADGHTQPDQAAWNVEGMANNRVQQVPVTVR
ncbi:MAG TPA: sulfite oxidase [Nocardioidaceae bacterium]|nr:sulfite oxidase [Nocardioidaceae bacterium]